jgi:hypothetical protein
MKQLLLFLFILVGAFGSMAQTATNFTCNDCNGMPHNLFAECDSGNVVVICWVMPCGACVSGALTCNNICQSYPANVSFYMVDDLANTSCTSLSSWAASNNITAATLFSNAAISMTDYGSSGMPKAVVIGGPNRTVFYNANNVFNASALQAAINQALTATSVEEPNAELRSLNIYPSPAKDLATLKYIVSESSEVTVDIYNLEGKLLKNIYSGRSTPGENRISINMESFSAGMYLVKLNAAGKQQYSNIIVTH